jgi:hypothetical protein
MDTQVDIVSNGDRGVEWRLLPVCAPARVGLMSRLFSALEEHDPELVIAAAVSGVFNGISVIFLLCRAPADATGSARAMAGHVAERLEASDHAVVPTTKARRHVRIAAPHRPRALLKVQLRTPDRPGAVQHLLIELRARLCEAVADNGLEALDVLYALTPVVDGHALSGRLLLGLPHHPSGAEKEWENLQWQEIGRIVSRGLAAGAYAPDGATRGTASSTSYDRTMQLNDDTVVTLDLVRTAVPTSEHTGPITVDLG